MRMPNNSDLVIVSPHEEAPEVKASPSTPIRREDGMVNYGFGWVAPLPHDVAGRDRRTSAEIYRDEMLQPGPAIALAGGGTAYLPSLAEQHSRAARDMNETQNAVKKNADALYFGAK